MTHVASEMERTNKSLPLLIGGATTSKVHSALKIDPSYSRGQTIYVPVADRVVAVADSLMSKESKKDYEKKVASEYRELRRTYKKDKANNRVSFELAKKNKLDLDFQHLFKPSYIGPKVEISHDINAISEYIDWSPFFKSWDLAGKFPNILTDTIVGEAASSLYKDAQNMIAKLISDDWVQAQSVIGFWPAHSQSDDIVLFEDDKRNSEIARLHTIRQQMQRKNGKPNIALSDFVAPHGLGNDYVGCFAVSVDLKDDAKEIANQYESSGDDYSSILLKALLDRLVEALAEYLHHRIRIKDWGYCRDESLHMEQIISEKYVGIRPAPGYPAQPDHTEKETICRILDCEKSIGIKLTESFALMPSASLVGLYFSHPQSKYFGVGKIGSDQVKDYAERKGLSLSECEKWLSPILGYVSSSAIN